MYCHYGTPSLPQSMVKKVLVEQNPFLLVSSSMVNWDRNFLRQYQEASLDQQDLGGTHFLAVHYVVVEHVQSLHAPSHLIALS